MRANSFHIASVYTKAMLLLNLEESIFKTVVEEITTCSQFKMESLSLSQIQAIGFQKETKNVSVVKDASDIKVSFIKSDNSSFLANKSSFIFDPDMIHPINTEGLDEYEDDDDPGFDTFLVNEENFIASCEELAQ